MPSLRDVERVEALADRLCPLLLKPPYDAVDILFAGRTWREVPRDGRVSVWAHSCMSSPKIAQDEQGAPQVDVWWDIHRPEIWGERRPELRKSWHPDYQGWLRSLDRPIVMMTPTQDLPTAVQFPLADVRAVVPGARFAGTMDWMVALALLLGVRRIGLYGCDYVTPHEAIYQRPHILYWIGVAHGMGVEVYLPKASPLLKNVLPGDYGPDFPPWPMLHHPRTVDWHFGEVFKALYGEDALDGNVVTNHDPLTRQDVLHECLAIVTRAMGRHGELCRVAASSAAGEIEELIVALEGRKKVTDGATASVPL